MCITLRAYCGGQYLSQETRYLVEVVDVIQHLYTCKTTIVIERLWGRSKLSKPINREEYGKKVILEDQLTSLTERTKESKLEWQFGRGGTNLISNDWSPFFQWAGKNISWLIWIPHITVCIKISGALLLIGIIRPWRIRINRRGWSWLRDCPANRIQKCSWCDRMNWHLTWLAWNQILVSLIWGNEITNRAAFYHRIRECATRHEENCVHCILQYFLDDKSTSL